MRGVEGIVGFARILVTDEVEKILRARREAQPGANRATMPLP
jgi:hypothetical protein